MLEKLPDALGHALSDVRAGLDKLTVESAGLRAGRRAIVLGSLAFADHAPMPERYTADAQGVSPPLHWSGVPAGTAELVLIVEDADSPTPQPLVHAIAIGLPGDADGALAEAALGGGDAEPLVTMGRNSALAQAWLAPDPPPGHGVHRYAFQLFALRAAESDDASVSAGVGRDALQGAIAARAIASGELIGTYQRPDGRIPLETPQPAAPA
jgi:Raf kinase inhibitor-like YbhB/YbcL family protein